MLTLDFSSWAAQSGLFNQLKFNSLAKFIVATADLSAELNPGPANVIIDQGRPGNYSTLTD